LPSAVQLEVHLVADRFLRTASARRTLLAVVPTTVLVAVLMNLLLDLAGGDPAFMPTVDRVAVFAVSTLVLWSAVVLVLAATGRLWPTVALCLVVLMAVAFANSQKLSFRFEPLYPTDLEFVGQPAFLFAMVEDKLPPFLVLVGLVMGICLLGHRITRQAFPSPVRSPDPGTRRRWVALRVGTVLGASAVLVQASGFSTTGNPVKGLYEAGGAEWQEWSQTRNYATNGFVAGFLYNVDNPVMTPPPGYGRAVMAELTDRYSARAQVLNSGRDADALNGVNVVLVLSESFTDPLRVSPLRFAEDPIPFVRQLSSRIKAGQTLATNYGGGTANMEFAALTGQSLVQFTPQTNTPYQQVVPQFKTYPSAARLFSSMGHRTVAIHPYSSEIYMRDVVYASLGFEAFLSEDAFRGTSSHTRFTPDADAFDEVLRQIQTHDDPAFINLVTMQNHVPYQDQFDDPVRVLGASDDDEANAVGNYARGLRLTDSAVQDFLADLSSSSEKTVVLFYGDHHPSVWSEATRQDVEPRVLREMPLFVWSNFGEDEPESLPTTSANYFMNLVFDEIGAALPPYYALLNDLYEELPAAEPGFMIGPDNQLIEHDDLSARAKRLLRDYRLVQYDFSMGERYALDEMFYPTDDSPLQAAD
jgi:phosphoglycerol transferase MdoB-like AlkP superfamily enzyme